MNAPKAWLAFLLGVLAFVWLRHQHGSRRALAMLLNPLCPIAAAKILGLKATVILLMTLLIKAKIRITAFSALGALLLLLQTLAFLAVAAAGAAIYAGQQRKASAA